jgi:uncharacterized membrane protein
VFIRAILRFLRIRVFASSLLPFHDVLKTYESNSPNTSKREENDRAFALKEKDFRVKRGGLEA